MDSSDHIEIAPLNGHSCHSSTFPADFQPEAVIMMTSTESVLQTEVAKEDSNNQTNKPATKWFKIIN